jgi:hypothetical protein
LYFSFLCNRINYKRRVNSVIGSKISKDDSNLNWDYRSCTNVEPTDAIGDVEFSNISLKRAKVLNEFLII